MVSFLRHEWSACQHTDDAEVPWVCKRDMRGTEKVVLEMGECIEKAGVQVQSAVKCRGMSTPL
jgi:hypothetical protein